MTKKRVAVIGGGFCGLVSMRWLKEEGFDVVCFEKTSRPAGTWCYREEESTPGVASIMPTTIINHSKEMGALSDFPPKKESNNYMRHSEMYSYIMDFCDKHDLLRHVKYNHETTLVKRTTDYDVTGQWKVTVRDLVSGEDTVGVYDGVAVCIGHINRPQMPTFEGQENFRGKVIHTHSLKGVEEYRGQNVVVVGMGCSALDAAVEISNVAKQVYLSCRSGTWVFSRVGPRGKPMDRILMRTWQLKCLSVFPASLCSKYAEIIYMNPNFSKSLYNVKPKLHILNKDPVFNDHIHSKLLTGSVVQKTDIHHFTEKGMFFQGEDVETPVDSVVMGTGYSWKFPFLEKGIITQDGGKINLFKCMYPPQLPHATLAIMGFVLTYGPGFPVGEMQCRLAAHLMVGEVKLPSHKVMMQDIARRYLRNKNRFQVDDKLSIKVDYLQYMDELASMLGAKPNFLKIFFTDLPLFYRMVVGPCLSYHYRLRGPNKWEGAREAIMTCDERIRAPLNESRRK